MKSQKWKTVRCIVELRTNDFSYTAKNLQSDLQQAIQDSEELAKDLLTTRNFLFPRSKPRILHLSHWFQHRKTLALFELGEGRKSQTQILKEMIK